MRFLNLFSHYSPEDPDYGNVTLVLIGAENFIWRCNINVKLECVELLCRLIQVINTDCGGKYHPMDILQYGIFSLDCSEPFCSFTLSLLKFRIFLTGPTMIPSPFKKIIFYDPWCLAPVFPSKIGQYFFCVIENPPLWRSFILLFSLSSFLITCSSQDWIKNLN